MRNRFPTAVLLALGVSAVSSTALGAPSLEDYKYFRALSIDLLGRMPTRQELGELEKPGFSVDKWLDQHLQGSDYADRMTRIYADLMRPQINAFRYSNGRSSLASVTFKTPDGKLTKLYFRPTQVRVRTAQLRTTLNADPVFKQCAAIRDPANDPNYVTLGCAKYERYDNALKANMCLLADEIGVRFNGGNFAPTPFPALPADKPGDPPRAAAVQAALDQYTTTVKPWWLYADYKAASPAQRYDAVAWDTRFPGYVLAPALLKEPDARDVMEVRVCKEELQASLTAKADNPAITAPVSCQTGYGAAQSSACGCGKGLEWCMPAASHSTTFPAGAFISSRNVLLGVDDPTDQVGFSLFDWQGLWLSQEPIQLLNHIFAEDRDFREVVTGRYTYVNGPLAQFYRFSARASWGDADLGQTPQPGEAQLPQDLSPHDVMTWKKVADRGPTSAGLLTQPWFLMKNATRRARGHVIYNTFLCRDFVAPAGLQLPISKEPDLTKRAGCAACHQTLEPLSAYFSRLVESDWNWLDPKLYPVACKNAQGGLCSNRYDPIFSTPAGFQLRGAYAAPDRADAGPAGAGQYLSQKPEFARCAVQNVDESFLGRDLRTEDADLLQQLEGALVQGGFRMKPMVKALLNSNAYRSANNLSSTVFRNGGQP